MYSFVKERYNYVKYKNSPYYKGSLSWDTLPLETRRINNMLDFKNVLSRIYNEYDPLVM